jgi:glutamine amidotransferase
VRENPTKTLLAVAHVRKRTRGRATLVNTHPFERELWGRSFVFAHNGTIRGARKLSLGRFRPIGQTDSEHAFCAMLAMLEHAFPRGYPQDSRKLWEAMAHIARHVGRDGTYNFLLGDGTHLFARCATRLCHIVRKAPFGAATLADEEVRVDFAQVTTPRDRVAVVATAPLTRDEQWITAAPNTLLVFRRGGLRATLAA